MVHGMVGLICRARFARDKPKRFTDTLDVIKFICKGHLDHGVQEAD